MDRIDELRIFARVVECESFTRAAETLRLPRSSVSTAVRGLEERMGARLLNRTTRRMALTEEGQSFYDRCLRLLGEYEEAETMFRRGAQPLGGRLGVNVPSRLARRVLIPALPDFLARHPGMEVELGVTDQAVDLLREGADCAIRVGALTDSALFARRFGELALINCASPAYLARHGTPRAPGDLVRHLAVGYAADGGRIEPWEYVQDGAVRQVAMRRQVTVGCAEAYIACCRAGLGLIQIPAYDVADLLRTGELVEVLPELRAVPLPIALVHPQRRHLSRRLQAFLAWVIPLLQARVLAPAA